MNLAALAPLVILLSAPLPAAAPTNVTTLIEKLWSTGRRQSEQITWTLLDAYAAAPTETLRATAQALARRCDNTVTEEALQRILKQNPAAAIIHFGDTTPPNLCVVRAIDALNRHPRVNASVGASVLIRALDSASQEVRLAALDALTAPAFANDTQALAVIRASARLAALLDDSDEKIRVRGIALSVSLSNDRAHPYLQKLVAFRQSRSLSIRQRTQEVLAQFGRPELRDDFRNITECVGAFRSVAMPKNTEAAGQFRENYGESIAKAVDSENAYCRIFAFEFLGCSHDGPDVCAEANRLIRKEKVEAVRVAMIGACYQCASKRKDKQWLTNIFKRSPNRFQKAVAARALLRGPVPRARMFVIKSLKDADRDTRWIAAQSLVDERSRWIRLHAEHASHPTGVATGRETAEFYATMEALVAAVSDPDWYVRNNAALALQEATGVDFGTHAKRWKAWWESTGRTMWGKPRHDL